MSADPPVGRVSHVLTGFGHGAGKWSGHGVLRRCQSCTEMYPKRMDACPECGSEPYAFAKNLRTGQLNRQLYEQAGLRPTSGDFR